MRRRGRTELTSRVRREDYNVTAKLCICSERCSYSLGCDSSGDSAKAMLGAPLSAESLRRAILAAIPLALEVCRITRTCINTPIHPARPPPTPLLSQQPALPLLGDLSEGPRLHSSLFLTRFDVLRTADWSERGERSAMQLARRDQNGSRLAARRLESHKHVVEHRSDLSRAKEVSRLGWSAVAPPTRLACLLEQLHELVLTNLLVLDPFSGHCCIYPSALLLDGTTSTQLTPRKHLNNLGPARLAPTVDLTPRSELRVLQDGAHIETKIDGSVEPGYLGRRGHGKSEEVGAVRLRARGVGPLRVDGGPRATRLRIRETETHLQVREVSSGEDECVRQFGRLEVLGDDGFRLIVHALRIFAVAELREGGKSGPDEELDTGGDGGVDDCEAERRGVRRAMKTGSVGKDNQGKEDLVLSLPSATSCESDGSRVSDRT